MSEHEDRTLAKKLIYLVLLVPWGLLPVTVSLLLSYLPSVLLGNPEPWGIAAVGWTFWSLLLFCWILWDGRARSQRSAREAYLSMMGLTCTFVIGLPAIAISLLPMFGPPASLLHALIPDGCDVALRDPDSATGKTLKSEKNLYIVGIDISESFLKGPEDSRVDMVHHALRSLLMRNEQVSFADSLHSEDVVHYYVFASESRYLSQLSNEVDGAGSEGRRHAKLEELPGELRRWLEEKEHIDARGKLYRTASDVPEFLEREICGEIKDRGSRFDRVKVILFTDLSYSATDDTMKARTESELDRFERCWRDQGKKASLFVFTMAAHEETQDAVNESVQPFLNSNLPAYQWQTVALDEYDRAQPEERILRPENLYDWVFDEKILYLKRGPDSRAAPIVSSLKLPFSEDIDTVLLRLQKAGSGEGNLRVRFMVDRVGDFILGFGDGDSRQKSFKRHEQDPLQIELVDPHEGPEGLRGELQIGVPGRSVLYRIRLVVLPVMDRDTLGRLKLIILILHLFPAVLSVFIFWTRFESPEPAVGGGTPPLPGTHEAGDSQVREEDGKDGAGGLTG